MWEPDPSWRRLPGAAGRPPPVSGWPRWTDGAGSSSDSRARRPCRSCRDPTYAGYWRREAEVARDPAVVDGPGLVPPEFGPVEEDDDGLTSGASSRRGSHLPACSSPGPSAGSPERPPSPGWASRRLLADRLAAGRAARRLAHPGPDDAGRRHRPALAAKEPLAGEVLPRGPEGRLHGDAVPGNFLAARAEDVVAVDWQCFGIGPVGADIGYYALSSREEFEVLLDCFLGGVGPDGGSTDPRRSGWPQGSPPCTAW